MGMRCTVLELVFGVVALDDKMNVVDYILFPKNPVDLAEKLHIMETGGVLDELIELVSRLKNKGFKYFVFERESSSRLIRERLNVDTVVESPSSLGRIVRRDLASKALELGFAKNRSEYLEVVQKTLDLLARRGIRERSSKGDMYVIQAVNALEELDKTINLFYGRLREWYGLYLSELGDTVETPEEFFKIVAEIGWKEEINSENLSKIGISKKTASAVLEALKTSIGVEMDKRDLEEIRAMASTVLKLISLRGRLEKYIEERIKEVSPNLYALVGPILAAKLIAQAGGLEALSKMPSSTIQVLGAEKALFRALRTGGRPPKHGLIFQHPIIRQSPKKLRGKISRVLAAKLSIAARIDAFTGKYVGDKLKEDLNRRIEEILKQV
jgi:nucleolar protein 56